MSDPLQVSVIVCTRNRARALSRCLDALLGCDPGFPWEAIVVDNGSSDDTARLIAERTAEGAPLRGVCEPHVGLSRARNRGAAEARAPLLAYLDDDAEPASGWLGAIRDAFRSDRAAVVSGPILPRYETTPPDWLGRIHLDLLSCQDLGPARRPVEDFPYVFGANLAIRREALERVGGFDPGFGRSGSDLLSGEDTLVCERVLAFGDTILYEPAAMVFHWIPPERLTRAYFRRRAFATGRTRALQARARLSRRELIGAALAKGAKLPAHVALLALRRALRDHGRAAASERSVLATLGFVRELTRR